MTPYNRRDLTELLFALDYEKNYRHGTIGHNTYMLIAKLARESQNPLVCAVVAISDDAQTLTSDTLVARAIEQQPLLFLPERK